MPVHRRNSVVVCFFGLFMLQAFSFTSRNHITSIRPCERQASSRHHSFSYRLQSKFDDDQDDCESVSSGIPQLPAIGASSFHNRLPSTIRDAAQIAFVSAKFQLQYTCKVCNTRNCHLVSRIAYREGVVITICKGCNSKHMIADNLGSGCLDGDTNIEEYFKARGMENSVNRVSQEVFQLEKILGFSSLVGEDGNPVLE